MKMLLQGSILQAIQEVPGDTKAKKLKYISDKGNEIAVKGTGWESIPEPLHELVNAEIAKRLKETELIIKLLNSEDALVVKRLLYIDNLFTDKYNLLRNFDYFYHEILSNVSVKIRNKIIKKVAEDLTGRDSKLAQEFFIGLTRTYNIKSALDILLACNEDFIYEQIMKYRIILPVSLVKKLYIRHPNIAIKYLKLSIYNENNIRRKLHDVRIKDYVNFLPCLIKNHFEEFIELYKSSYVCNTIHLSRKKTKMFLDKGLTMLKKTPEDYLTILDLELITKRLNSKDFHAVIAGIFPEKVEDCNVDYIFHLLRYFPTARKVPLIRLIFNEIYNEDLYDYPEKISGDLLLLLSTDDRIKLARQKIDLDSNASSYYKRSWRCYLSSEETIPLLKKEISESSSEKDRLKLLMEMIFVCKVNDDKAALLDVLQYFVQRHKNESECILSSILGFLHSEHELHKLEEEHWKVLDHFIKRLEIKKYYSCIEHILEDALHYKLDHGLPVDEYIMFCIRINFNSFSTNWNYLKSYPNYEKLCLEKFLDLVEIVYPDNNEIWKNFNKDYFFGTLISNVSDFNTRNKDNDNVSPIDIRGHPWIMKNIESVLADKNSDINYLENTIINLDVELHHTWFKDKRKYIDVKSEEIIKILKTDYIKILNDWEHYLLHSLKSIFYKRTQNFVKAVRWYRDIPINFAEHLLKIMSEEKTSKASTVLGFLLDGPLFEKIIDPLIPFEPSIDIDKDETKDEYETVCRCLMGSIKCNPPVSFNILKRLCTSDYLPELIKVVYAVAEKTCIREVVQFAEYLLDQRISAKKHGMRLVWQTVSLEQKCDFLFQSWKSESHRSIRNILLPKIKQSFVDMPNDETWNLVHMCFQNLTVSEEEDLIEKLTILDGIPDEYVVYYIKEAIASFEKLKFEKNPRLSQQLIRSIFIQLDNTFKEILPIEFQQDLLKKHFFDAALNSSIAMINTEFLFTVYLTNSSEESRLTCFAQYLGNFVKLYCTVSDSIKIISCPVRKLINDLINVYQEQVGSGYRYPQLTKLLKETLSKIMQPHEYPVDFLRLTWIELFEESELDNHNFALAVAQRLDFLISLFGNEFTLVIALSLNEFLCVCSDKATFDFIDEITEINAVSTFTIATILFLKKKIYFSSFEQRYIFEKLCKSHHHTVQALINNNSYVQCYDYDDSISN
ncbi:uncharacterized protein LOC142324946 isoform X1 [Lycorma delicatula]|uniref:uncharacterized protein LOC142324946 isoform X1 n=1 Tax=Lycorma delicatula TaxID=130591 RepID=UPI003F517019